VFRKANTNNHTPVNVKLRESPPKAGAWPLSYNHVLTNLENGVEMKLWLRFEIGRLRISADAMGLYEFA
jgi:hypothetical protein